MKHYLVIYYIPMAMAPDYHIASFSSLAALKLFLEASKGIRKVTVLEVKD